LAAFFRWRGWCDFEKERLAGGLASEANSSIEVLLPPLDYNPNNISAR
jgi:hypothetical protein